MVQSLQLPQVQQILAAGLEVASCIACCSRRRLGISHIPLCLSHSAPAKPVVEDAVKGGGKQQHMHAAENGSAENAQLYSYA